MSFSYEKKGVVCFFAFLLALAAFLMGNSFFGGGMFSEDVDGFFSQINSVAVGADLGSLEIIHKIRYFLVFPFYSFSEFSFVQGILLVVYVLPVLAFLKVPWRVRFISMSVFFLPAFFSYRSVLTMVAIYVVVAHFFWRQQSFKFIFLSFFYSFLSTGCFLGLVLIFLFSMKWSLLSKLKKFVFLFSFSILFLVFSGSIFHKFFFFIDPVRFGSASAVSLKSIEELEGFSFLGLMMSVLERGVLFSAFGEDFLRFSMLVLFWFFSLLFLFLNKSRLSLGVFLVYSIGCLLEGLMAFSFIFSLFILFSDYIIRQAARSLFSKPGFV
ncbi:hypothetical protein [Halomonas sp. NCCP-2165]|nr:hypothetical protein [Halomonas sp. NCCP-2165]